MARISMTKAEKRAFNRAAEQRREAAVIGAVATSQDDLKQRLLKAGMASDNTIAWSAFNQWARPEVSPGA